MSKQNAALNYKNSYSILQYKDNLSMEGAPVNFVTDELLAFIAEWESSTLTTTSSSDCSRLDAVSAPVSQDMFEPNRRLNGFAPPKRFDRSRGKTKQ